MLVFENTCWGLWFDSITPGLAFEWFWSCMSPDTSLEQGSFVATHPYTALSARCGVINGREAKTNVQRSVK